MEDGIEHDEIPEFSPEIVPASKEGEVPGLMPELDHAHGHHGHGSGIPWLDLIVGISAIFISVVSLFVSIEHGRTMERMVDQNQKMVEASTMPLLKISGSEFDPSGKPMFREVLGNGGVGPAIIDRFEVRYKDVVYIEENALLRACCAATFLKANKDEGTQIRYSNVSGTVLPAHEEIVPVFIKPGKGGQDLFNEFNRARDADDISFHACYCSVLNECWTTDFDRKRPQPVSQCKVGPNEKLW
jgi:hypothetical protein